LTNFTKALLVWFAAHYVFHLEFSKFYRDAAIFLAAFVIEVPIDGKRTATYLSISTDIANVRDQA
jgi:hypothetical protein